MLLQRAWEKSAGSTPDSAQPPTPSATPKVTTLGASCTLLTKNASSPLSNRAIFRARAVVPACTPSASSSSGLKLMTFFVGESFWPFPDAEAAMRYDIRRSDREEGLEWNDLFDTVLLHGVTRFAHGDRKQPAREEDDRGSRDRPDPTTFHSCIGPRPRRLFVPATIAVSIRSTGLCPPAQVRPARAFGTGSGVQHGWNACAWVFFGNNYRESPNTAEVGISTEYTLFGKCLFWKNCWSREILSDPAAKN